MWAALAIFGGVLLAVLAPIITVVAISTTVFAFGQYLETVSNVVWDGLGPKAPPGTPEPAARQFFHKAVEDFIYVTRTSFRTAFDLRDSFYGGSWDSAGCLILVGAPIGVLIGASILLGLSLFYLLVITFVCPATLVVLATGILRLVAYVGMVLRRSFFACPHAGCYQRIALPIYLCPGCGALHRRLLPGSYGTFFRRCQCGRQLPTMFLVGRGRLPSLCPNPSCNRPLHGDMGQVRNLHFPVVGGASAGKTSLMAATLVELSWRAERGEHELAFVNANGERISRAWRDSFRRGSLLAKTPENAPNAFTVKLKDTQGRQTLLNLYDAAGELYQGIDELHGHAYYSYLHGVLFIIDPFSLPSMRVGEGSPLTAHAQAQAIKASSEHPERIYGRMVSTLRGFSGATGPLAVPLAVVLTKSDALAPEFPSTNGPLGHVDSDAARRWLVEHGEGNLVRTIEAEFAAVRYFAVSALGRAPVSDQSAPFVPNGALAPLAWLLAKNGVAIRSDHVASPSARTSEEGGPYEN
jgi:hypothetical protein